MSIKAAAVLVTMALVPASMFLAGQPEPKAAETPAVALTEVELSTRALVQQISTLDLSLQRGISRENAEEVLYVRGQLVALSERLGELADDLDTAPYLDSNSNDQLIIHAKQYTEDSSGNCGSGDKASTENCKEND